MATDHRQVQSTTTADIASMEWRWIILVSGVLLLILSLPLAAALWIDASNPDTSFMGVLSNPLDGATYLSKIQVGKEGYWQTIFRHSPNIQQGAYVTLMYNSLGQLSRYMGLSNIIVYHAGRLIGSLLMLLALFQLGAIIWRRKRTRRVFFMMVVLGSGLGWLMVLFGFQTADLIIPEAYPLYSAVTNVQFPFALFFISIMAAIVIVVFRPGFTDSPTLQNGGAVIIVCSLALALIAPHALVPFTAAVILVIAINWIRYRKLYMYQLRWLVLIVLPAVPVAGYYLAEIRYNEVVQVWMLQNVTRSPNPLIFLAGFGVPLLIGLPGIYRAIRRFESDGDQFMLMWLLSMLVMVYAPTDAQRRFSIALMLPIAYFATRSLSDYWLDNRTETYRTRFLVGVYAVSALTYGLLMVIWFQAARSTDDTRFYLDSDYLAAFNWLDVEAEPGSVVLASEGVNLWLPEQSGVSVIYGHPFESFGAEKLRDDLESWHNAESAADSACSSIVENYGVRYVLIGPAERNEEGEASPCVENLTEVQQFGDVILYAP